MLRLIFLDFFDETEKHQEINNAFLIFDGNTWFSYLTRKGYNHIVENVLRKWFLNFEGAPILF